MELIITDQNFDSELQKATTPVLIDFFATWCGPCQTIAPIVKEVAEENKGKLLVAKANIDECTELVSRFNIMSIPTLIIFNKDKEVVKQIVGFHGKDLLIKEIYEVI